MRKLFFIILLFGFGNSFAQGKINGVINLTRLIQVEPNYAVRINVSEGYIIQPEISYRFATIQGRYLVGEYSMLQEGFDAIENEYKFNSLMLALTQGFGKGDVRVDISGFYRLKFKNDMGYHDYGCGETSSCPITTYSGGGIGIKKYGVKLLVNEKISDGIEFYAGVSIYKREMKITYDYLYSEIYISKQYDYLQTKMRSKVLPGLHFGLNLVL